MNLLSTLRGWRNCLLRLRLHDWQADGGAVTCSRCGRHDPTGGQGY